MIRTLAALLLLLALPVLAGCGGVKAAVVSGTLKFDGNPLSEGEFIFVAADGTKTPAAG